MIRPTSTSGVSAKTELDSQTFAEQALANQSQLSTHLKDRYDFIVCGSGSSGSVVAARLAENPDVSVLLLEAGGSDNVPSVLEAAQWPLNLGSERDWGFVSQPEKHLKGRRVPQSMGKVLGGGSSINVMTYARGHKVDWDYFASEANDDAWSYSSVLDIYRHIEDWAGAPDPQYRGVGGPLFIQPTPYPSPITVAMLKGANAAGLPTFENQNGRMMEAPAGASIIDMTVRDGKRQSAFRSYVYPLMDQPNLTVLTGALVTRVVFDGKRAAGVEVQYEVGAKASTLVTHVPDAITHGAEIRDNSMVARISIDKAGRTDGVVYFDSEGNEHFQRARAVIVCGYALETPRLLFNSACPGHEQGLANSSGTLGKYLMAQAGNVILGKFDDLIRQYKAPPAHALTEEFYETDPKRGFARGFAVQTVGPLPIAFSKQIMAAKGLWGWGLRREMMDYNHWSPLGLLGEILPWEDNRIELADGRSGRHDARDRFGLPVAQVTFSLKDNDKKLIEYGKNKVMDIMRAAGAKEVVQEQRYAHLVGGARMSATADTGVCDKFGRTWDVPNLFVMDGSVFPTQGSANPGLTIQALAARTADYLITQNDTIFQSNKRDLVEPRCRLTLSPPGTFSKGVPHF